MFLVSRIFKVNVIVYKDLHLKLLIDISEIRNSFWGGVILSCLTTNAGKEI